MNNAQERNLSLRRCSGLPEKLSKVSKFESLTHAVMLVEWD